MKMSGAILLTDNYGATALRFPVINRPTPLLSATAQAFGWLRRGKQKATDTFGYSGGPERGSIIQSFKDSAKKLMGRKTQENCYGADCGGASSSLGMMD